MAGLGLSLVAAERFWAGRSVFLTGHSGFKGGWLALLLRRLGAAVTGYSLPPEPGPTLFEAARVAEGMAGHMGDLCDGEALRTAMAASRPSIVFHLAAQGLVRRARREPRETFATNVMGTLELLEAVRAVPQVEAVVIVTTDKVYANEEAGRPFRESDPLGGKEPYNGSKACCEILVDTWRHAYLRGRPAIATARAGNVIGGGDWAEDRLIPDAIRAFQAGEALRIRSPDAVRPWQHVLEPLTGYLLQAQALVERPGEVERPLNFGPSAEDSRPVRAVADAIAALWGAGARWTGDAAPQDYEARLLELDAGLARRLLGWTPRWGLDAGLRATVDWFRAHAEGADMRAVTLAQIEAHLHG